jgi:hypothetical protein
MQLDAKDGSDVDQGHPLGTTPTLQLGELVLEHGRAASNGKYIVCLAPPYCRCLNPYHLYHHLSPDWYDSPAHKIAGEKAMFIGSTSHEDLLRDLAALWKSDLTQGWYTLDGAWKPQACRCDPGDWSLILPRPRIAFYTEPPPPPVYFTLPDEAYETGG